MSQSSSYSNRRVQPSTSQVRLMKWSVSVYCSIKLFKQCSSEYLDLFGSASVKMMSFSECLQKLGLHNKGGCYPVVVSGVIILNVGSFTCC